MPRAAFTDAFNHPPAAAAIAPARVNLLGDHTDYNAGLAIPIAIDLTCTCCIAPINRPQLHAIAVDLPERAECPLADAQAARDTLPPWARLALGTAAITLDHLNKSATGLELAFSSNIPQGAGLSSSAALCVSIATAIESLYQTPIDPLDLARLCQRAEHEFAHTPCGLLDQLAIIHARKHHATLIDFSTLAIEHVPIPVAARFVLIDTATTHDNASGEYAARRTDCESLANDLSIPSLSTLDPARIDAQCALNRDHRWHLARHVVTENARVRAFAQALAASDLPRAAELMNQSHASLSSDYRVSLPQIDALANRVRATPGVLACRLTGAGLGGHLVALCDSEDAVSRLNKFAVSTLATPAPARRALRSEEIHHRGSEDTEKNN